MWCLRTWFIDGLGSAGLVVRLDDLNGLSQPKWFHDSVRVLSIVLLFLYFSFSPSTSFSGIAQYVAFSMCLISLLFLNRSSSTDSSFKNYVRRILEIKENERRQCNDALYLYITFLSFGNSRALAFGCQMLGWLLSRWSCTMLLWTDTAWLG